MINEAYFISPDGEIIRSRIKHIVTVLENPEKFGLNNDVIDFIYRMFGEKKGQEGKAREEILTMLFKNGWIRLRRYRNFWTANVLKLTRQAKSYLSKWANAMLKGKFGWKEEDPDIPIKIDQKGKKPMSSTISDIAASDSFVVESKIYEVEELKNRPLIPEAKKILKIRRYL